MDGMKDDCWTRVRHHIMSSLNPKHVVLLAETVCIWSSKWSGLLDRACLLPDTKWFMGHWQRFNFLRAIKGNMIFTSIRVLYCPFTTCLCGRIKYQCQSPLCRQQSDVSLILKGRGSQGKGAERRMRGKPKRSSCLDRVGKILEKYRRSW